MALFVLDTDILSLYQHDHQQVLQRVASHRGDTIALGTVTIEEQIKGWSAKAQAATTAQQHESAATFLLLLIGSWQHFQLVPVTIASVQRYEQLLKAKLNVGRYDLRIASIALEWGATLVTRNRRDFSRVPGLVIKDWSV